MAGQPSLQELENKYPDPDFHHALFDLLTISMLLTDSIIKKDYVVPPALNAQIGLTDYGQKIYEQLRARKVPFHEARLLCFLEMYYADLMIDVSTTNTAEIIEILSKQVVDRALLFPFRSGRILYDKYFEAYEDDPKRYLSSDETQDLLKGIPQGVNQYSRYVTGPYGILGSRSTRLWAPSNNVPLSHCPNVSCTTVHSVMLSTNFDASINKHRETLGKILEREDSGRSAWSHFIENITAEYLSLYQDWAVEPIIILIGDALTDLELSKLFSWLLDNGDGYLRGQLGTLGVSSSVQNNPLNRAQLLQLILLEEDDLIVSGLDALVRSDSIKVPDGEIRTPVVNKRSRFGQHGLHAELGHHGVRLRSTGSSLAPLRARQLVERMYRLDEEQDRLELDWQMREETRDSLEAKLENYLQTKSPRESIGSLVLARRSNVVVATTSLRLNDRANENDDDLISAVLWKLGFSIEGQYEVHRTFWNAHESMLQQTRQGLMSAHATNREDIRGAAATYFTSLEKLLDDSLSYTIWALTSDHYTSPRPFVYRPHIDRMPAFKRLNDFDGSRDHKDRLGNKNTLSPLTRGFARLGQYLADCEARQSEFDRKSEEFPEWVPVQSLEKFPFTHTVAFLDLIPDCRRSIIRILAEITERFTSGQVPEARNDWLHGQRTISLDSLDRLRESVDQAREAVRHIEENGMCRQRYLPVSDIVDGDHRRTVVLASPDGRKYSLFGPSPFSWLRLPRLAAAQYVMNSARFAEPAECLRFTVEVESAYSTMWENYPRRPRLQRGRTVAGQSALPTTDQIVYT